MKTALLLVLCFTATLVRGEALTATITEQTKMELTRGKGTIVLKAGTKVDVVSQDGDVLGVVYHSITGLVPAAKTDFKGEAPKAAQVVKTEPAPKPAETPKAAAPAPKPAEAKPADEKPAASASDAPTTNYGKMVKKARDNEASHKENLVEPTNENAGATKKE